MMNFAWWPVMLILFAAPFATYGFTWLDKQRLLAAYGREVADTRRTAYAEGREAGIAEVRAEGVREVIKTREIIKWLEVPVVAPTPAEIIALCKASASCRDRGNLP